MNIFMNKLRGARVQVNLYVFILTSVTLACALLAITFERKGFSKIHELQSKKSLKGCRRCCWLQAETNAVAARAVTDNHTDTQSNPRCACAPRVNQVRRKTSQSETH